MKMITAPKNDPHNFVQRSRRIRAQVATVLTKWGLLPRFKRWRLTQDPETDIIVLFGILNNAYIASHSSIPFSNYFDPRLLHDLADKLQVQVVSCNSDGLRYAFILDRGQLGSLPTHIDYPFIDNGKVLVRVVYDKSAKPAQTAPLEDDHARVQDGVGAFLKVFDDIKIKDGAVPPQPVQVLPEILVIDEDEFNKRVAEHEARHQRIIQIKKLIDEAVG
jgi:hypothetical protein